MRMQITVDVDGTDEAQLDMLEEWELTAEENQIIKIASDYRALDATVVGVEEIPERQVRGPEKKFIGHPFNVYARHRSDRSNFLRVLSMVRSSVGYMVFLEGPSGDPVGPFPVDNYEYRIVLR